MKTEYEFLEELFPNKDHEDKLKEQFTLFDMIHFVLSSKLMQLSESQSIKSKSTQKESEQKLTANTAKQAVFIINLIKKRRENYEIL